MPAIASGSSEDRLLGDSWVTESLPPQESSSLLNLRIMVIKLSSLISTNSFGYYSLLIALGNNDFR